MPVEMFREQRWSSKDGAKLASTTKARTLGTTSFAVARSVSLDDPPARKNRRYEVMEDVPAVLQILRGL